MKPNNLLKTSRDFGFRISDCGLNNSQFAIRNSQFSSISHFNSGQALIEFAIIGSLALMALALLIQIGLRANFQQEMDQQTFRLALRVAQQEDEVESQAIQYHHFRSRGTPNPAQTFAALPISPSQGSATVTWGEYLTFLDDDRDSQPRVVVVNDYQMRNYRSEDFPSGQPLVSNMNSYNCAQGRISQTSGRSSELTTSTGGTEVVLSNGESLADGVMKVCNFDGSNWSCSDGGSVGYSPCS